MKGKIVLLLGVVLVIILLIWYGYSLSSDDFDITSSDFAIENTSSVTQYYITSDTDTIILDKEQGVWRLLGTELYVEEKNIAMINNLLPLLVIEAPIEYKYSAAIGRGDMKAFKNVVVKSGDDIVRLYRFYNSGTDIFVDVDNKEAPCYLKIAGVSGSFSDLFSLDKRYWLSNVVFLLSPEYITEMDVYYYDNDLESFKLKRRPDGQFVVSKDREEFVIVANKDKLYSFLSFASRLRYKSIKRDNSFEEDNKSQLLARVHLKAKKEHIIKVYKKLGKSGDEDLFNAYVVYNNDDKVYEVPYLSLDKFLKEYSYFK